MPTMPGWPVAAVEHQGRALALLQLAVGLLAGGGPDALLFLAALGVEGIQMLGQAEGLHMVLAAQQLESGVGRAHASGGIDARRQTEDHLSGVEAGGRVGTAHGLEGGDAGTGGLGQLVQPAAHEDAVLPAQAHDVGQRAQGHKIQHLVHLEAAARMRGQGRVDGGHEEKGHAHTGQMGAGHVVFRARGVADAVGRGPVPAAAGGGQR